MRNRIGVLGLALVLAGCGAQPLATSAARSGLQTNARQAASVFPANPKMVWQYEVVAHPADDPYVDYNGTETVKVEGIKRDGANTVLNLRAIDDFTNEYRFPVIIETPSGVSLNNVTYWGVAADTAENLTIDFLHLPAKPGAKWDDGRWVGEIKGKETVKVPAGTFEAYKLSVIGTYDDRYTAVGTYWVAPGTGIVKSDLNIPGWNVEAAMIPAGAKARRPANPLPKGVRIGR